MSVSHQEGMPRRALLLTAAGVTLAVTAGVAACRSQPAADFGSPTVAAAPASTPAITTPAAPRVPIADGALPAAAAADAPNRLRIDALDLDAAVDAVGIDVATGDFAVPPSVDRVGWYRYGPGFSAKAGSIVVAGHVDSAAEGKGAFFRLGDLDAGDLVTLTGADGKDRTFEVVARERYRKTAIPLTKYFARDGAPRLTLITCGGPFDPKTRHYRDNVVVTATARS
ncbi:class F sortase [Paractinoplanes atraurantiacus]|uniref:Sortase family protein n=1 Tax=Paractinoplanes atraurantiacus TaxID=1036182 RepID=A0A285JVH2_9ACTN|nr:class F sortase [Actinoplanes atraurantiacus]SNY64319.1 Sortase family protein [Actinoplanes atraurantiacus]